MYKVQKKDGRIEDFDRNKIINGLTGAGCSAEEAEKVVSEIEVWLPTVAVDGVVKTLGIRAKGLEVLGTVNPAVAATFDVYQKQPKQAEEPVEPQVEPEPEPEPEPEAPQGQ